METTPVAAEHEPPVDVAPAPVALPVEAIPEESAAPPPAAQPTPVQKIDVVGVLGVVLLALLALAILAAGLLFFRRRHPAAAGTLTEPVAPRQAEPRPLVERPVAPLATAPAMPYRRDPQPVRGALPSDGAAVDLPAAVPESYEERSALLKRMVGGKPDRANPFTDRKARQHRARLILQSLGTTFDREPRIDLSQYPNNWPELQRPRYKAA
jgi:hypothetical protein